MAESIMLDKAKDFAVEIINLCKSIKETKYITNEEYKLVINNCGQIRRMLISSINTVK